MEAKDKILTVSPTDTLKEVGFKSQKVTIEVIKKKDLPADADVIGFLNGKYTNKPDDATINMTTSVNLIYQLTKPERTTVIGFYRKSATEYVAVTRKKNYWLLLLLILAAIIVGIIVCIRAFNTKQVPQNIVSISDIPDGEELPEPAMAYITGEAEQVVTQTQPYYFLKNDELNTDQNYTFKYTVYAGDKLVFESGQIQPGQAEQWDAYNCPDIHDGSNEIHYIVDVYDQDLLVATSNVNGLYINKQ